MLRLVKENGVTTFVVPDRLQVFNRKEKEGDKEDVWLVYEPLSRSVVQTCLFESFAIAFAEGFLDTMKMWGEGRNFTEIVDRSEEETLAYLIGTVRANEICEQAKEANFAFLYSADN